MGRRLVHLAAIPLAVAGIAAGSLGSGASSAGRPTPVKALLCGLWMTGSDRVSGNSAQDHPAGASAMGQYYPYTGQNCEGEYDGMGGFNNGTQMFSWSIDHSNVDVNRERGTEHGLFMLSSSSDLVAGFNGHITNYDFTTPLTAAAPDPDGNRQIYYASGHAYDPSGSPSGPGNFNTHGGADTGQHFRGTYGTIVYQDTNNMMSPCQSGSSNYCFEAILLGQTN
jgi:hypothetical protein